VVVGGSVVGAAVVGAAVVGAAVVGAAVVGAAVDGAAVVDGGSAALELPPVPLQAASASVAASQNATTASPRACCANLFASHRLHRLPTSYT
jgi:hypothetical protein